MSYRVSELYIEKRAKSLIYSWENYEESLESSSRGRFRDHLRAADIMRESRCNISSQRTKNTSMAQTEPMSYSPPHACQHRIVNGRRTQPLDERRAVTTNLYFALWQRAREQRNKIEIRYHVETYLYVIRQQEREMRVVGWQSRWRVYARL